MLPKNNGLTVGELCDAVQNTLYCIATGRVWLIRIIHLFIECDLVKHLWESLWQFFVDEYQGIGIDTGPIAGIWNRIVYPKKYAANFMCLLLKQYIYSLILASFNLSL